ARYNEYDLVPSSQLSIDMKFGAALFVAALLVACCVDPAAAACDRVINTVCATNVAANLRCLDFGGGGLFCSGTCVNAKPCCKRCPPIG
ncbi:hypothetical protein AAVH_21814, partial [Aphelenchoides avenae]